MTDEKLAELETMLAKDRYDAKGLWWIVGIAFAVAVIQSLITRGTWKLEPKDGDDFAISAGVVLFYQFVVCPVLDRMEILIALGLAKFRG